MAHYISLQKFISEIHLGLGIRHWSFPSLAAAQQTVFHYSNPALTEANKALQHLQKTTEKNRAPLPISNEQMKFHSGELGRAESKSPAQLQRTT